MRLEKLHIRRECHKDKFEVLIKTKSAAFVYNNNKL